MDANILIGDVLEKIKEIPDSSINLVITSPPYSDIISYGKEVEVFDVDEYVDWLGEVAREVYRVLTPDGSFIMNLGNKTQDNSTKSLYVMKTAIEIAEGSGLGLYDEYFWVKPNPFPTSGIKRLTNGVEYIYHYAKNPGKQKAYTERIQVPVATSTSNSTKYDFGYNRWIDEFGTKHYDRVKGKGRKTDSTTKKPNNVFYFPTSSAKRHSKGHPAAFSEELPEFFIKWLTDEFDVVLDPFAGSGTTGVASHKLGRNFIGIEVNQRYVELINKRMGLSPLLKY